MTAGFVDVLGISAMVLSGPERHEGSFTADAWIKGTTETFFLADAVIKETDLADTFTADAVIQRTPSGTFTADAHIIHVIEGAFSADSVLKRTESDTFTADAVIVEDGTYLILAEAVIKRTESDTFTADAYIVIPSVVSDTFTADAAIFRTYEPTFTADAAIKNTTAGTFMADAYIRSEVEVVTGTFSARAWIIPVPPAAAPSPTFEINGASPPTGGDPQGGGYKLTYPKPKGTAGSGQAVGAVGGPWIEIVFVSCSEAVFDWYNDWVPEGEVSANVNSVQAWDPYLVGGANWYLFDGPNITIWRPVARQHLYGQYYNVRILITNLS